MFLAISLIVGAVRGDKRDNTMHAINFDSPEDLILSGDISEAEAFSGLSDHILRRLLDGTDAPSQAPTSGPTTHHGRIKIPDGYHAMCHKMVNAFRAREGLPAVQRWREMERCSDRGARFDQVRDLVHGSISNGIGCDFSEYFPIAQNSCKNWDNSTNTIESCTEAMWMEKYIHDAAEHPGLAPRGLNDSDTDTGFDAANHFPDADGESGDANHEVGTRRRLQNTDSAGNSHVRCNTHKGGDQCGHYYNLRGGREGYNAYDRVACGFAIRRVYFCPDNYHRDFVPCDNDRWGQVDLYINQNFGRGTPQVSTNHPEDTVYGFECGGDKDTHPTWANGHVKMLDMTECNALSELPGGTYQYKDCSEDYTWWGCTQMTCDRNKATDDTCADYTVNNDITGSSGSYQRPGEVKPYVGTDGAGHDGCQWLKDQGTITVNVADPSAGCPATFSWPPPEINGQAWKWYYYTHEVCKKTCGRCACTVQPFDEGFFPPTSAPTGAPVTIPTPAPTTFAPTGTPTSAPTMFDCASLKAGKCKKKSMCVFDNTVDVNVCIWGTCEDITKRSICKFNDRRCKWKNGDKICISSSR